MMAFGGLYMMAEIKSGPSLCKTSILTAVLSYHSAPPYWGCVCGGGVGIIKCLDSSSQC